MKRRDFLGGSLLTAFLMSKSHLVAQERMRRIALLRTTTPQERDFAAFQRGLDEAGFSVGKNIIIDVRYAFTVLDRLPILAAELAAMNPDVIAVDGVLSTRAAAAATTSTPIVFTIVPDPVGMGIATSLSRPGGRMTGQSTIANETLGKRIEIMRESLSGLVKLAVLVHPDNQVVDQIKLVSEVAGPLGVEIIPLRANNRQELDAALARLPATQAQALLTVNSPLFYSERDRVIRAATGAGLPSMHPEREFVEAGGLLAYGIDFPALWQRTGTYVSRILSGQKPGDLPIEQPTKFVLTINLKTAKTLGLVIPPGVLTQADEVIE
jgi:putative ABC transport system substrate-binding protein